MSIFCAAYLMGQSRKHKSNPHGAVFREMQRANTFQENVLVQKIVNYYIPFAIVLRPPSSVPPVFVKLCTTVQ